MRCFAHVKDVVAAVMRLMETEEAVGRVINIGGDQPISILDLARRVKELAESDSPIEFQSYADAYGEDFEDIRRRVSDLSRLRSTIDYQPHYDLDSVIREVIAYRKR